MNQVFVDTSAVIALMVGTDQSHPAAKVVFDKLMLRNAELITTSHVLVETYALLERRIGIEAVRDFRSYFSPLFDVIWINQELHEQALDLLLQRASRNLSLVDVSSFLVMRLHKIDEVFASDRHFSQEGFRLIH